VVALVRAEKLELVETISATGEVVLSPEWDTPGPVGAGGRQLAGDITAADDSFFHNSSLGFIGQLDVRLGEVRAAWSDGGLNVTTPVEFVGSWSVTSYESSWAFLQLGFFAVLPYFLELWLERDFTTALWENVRLIAFCSWIFFLFSAQTKGFHFASALSCGKAGYVATGRGYVIEPGSFISLYAIYAKSHIYNGAEAFIYLMVYYQVSALSNPGTWTIWLFIVAMIYAPLLFNPQALSITNIKPSFAEVRLWLAGEAPVSNDHKGSWAKWHAFRLATPRAKSFTQKLQTNVFEAIPRAMLLIGVASRLEVDSSSQPSHRSLLVLSSCVLFCACQLAFYVLARARLLGAPAARGEDAPSGCIGLHPLRLAWRLLLGVGIVSAYCLLSAAMFSQYVTLGASGVGFRNGFLLFFGGGLFSSFFIQAFVSLRLAKLDKGASLTTHAAHLLKKSFIDYADFWYFGYDTVLTFGVLFTLLCFSMLPLLSLQSQLLFNRDFAKVIALKLRRAEFLERILS